MPYSKRPRKRNARKRPYRRRKNYKPTIQRAFGTGSASASQIVKMRYVERLSLDAGVGGIAYDTFTATSAYDPYTGIGGHQPLGFSEWMTFYNHYTVLGSKITATASNQVDDTLECYLIASLKDNSGPATSGISTIIEQGSARYVQLSGKSGSVKKVRAFYSPKKFFALKDVKDAEQLRGTAITNPTENAYFQISVVGATSSSNPPIIDVLCVIEYTLLLTERKVLTQSG